MSVPEGAQSVTYYIHTGDDAPDLDLRFEMNLGAGRCLEVLDEAAQVAAEHIMSRVQEAHPEARIRAHRVYTGQLAGQPWPSVDGPGVGDS